MLKTKWEGAEDPTIPFVCNEHIYIWIVLLLFSEMYEYKMKYDESEHIVARSTKFITDKFTGVFGKKVKWFMQSDNN